MLECVTVENMRKSDHMTIDQYVSGYDLIERAALAIFQSVEWKGNIGIMTGSGNNGADGYALSALLKNAGYTVTVINVSGHMHEDCAHFADKAVSCHVPIIDYVPGNRMLDAFDIIVDCLLGTGFNGRLRGIYRSAIQEINEANAYVVCVDINSGMNGDTGEGELIVFSDLTVTIQFVKIGMVSENVGKYIKRLICAPIGIRLYKNEFKICSDDEWNHLKSCSKESNAYRIGDKYIQAPKWLDMK